MEKQRKAKNTVPVEDTRKSKVLRRTNSFTPSLLLQLDKKYDKEITLDIVPKMQMLVEITRRISSVSVMYWSEFSPASDDRFLLSEKFVMQNANKYFALGSTKTTIRQSNKLEDDNKQFNNSNITLSG